MLPKLTIIMLLAAILPESMSGPTNATNSGPDKGASNNSIEPFQGWVQNAPFLLDQAISEFSKKLMTALLDNPLNKRKNVVISPTGIHMGMMMILCASSENSQTRQQIANALGIEDSLINTYLSNYLEIIKDFAKMKSEEIDLEMANGIFIKDGIPVKKGYQDLLQGAFLTSVDNFGNDPSKAIEKINNFVDKGTNGMIKRLMEAESIDDDTLLVVLSVLYFRGNWLNEFDQSLTKPMKFTLLNGQEITLNQGMTMTLEDEGESDIRIYDYTPISSWVLELPYKDGHTFMCVILPYDNDYDSLKFAAELFDYRTMQLYVQYYDNGLKITLPGFEASFDMDLVDTMTTLGMTKLTSDHGADLRKMTNQLAKVSAVITKTVVTVNEKGTIGAAAIGIGVNARDPSNDQIELNFNRPFVIKIIETRSDRRTTLFEGVILDPSGQGNPGALPVGPRADNSLGANKTR